MYKGISNKLAPTVLMALYLLLMLSHNVIAQTTHIEPPSEQQELSKENIKIIDTSLRQVLKNDQNIRSLIHKKQQAKDAASNIPLQQEITELWEKQRALDVENQSIVADILDNFGWPTQEQFKGTETAQAVFLVIQHADVSFQERYFPLMQKATENGEIPPGAFAQLHDSILVSKGEKQRYGTQIRVNNISGEPFFYPISDEVNVDVRRAAVGLAPIAEYAALYKVKYMPPQQEILEDQGVREIENIEALEK